MLDAQRLAEVVKAVRKEGQKWAARWEEYRDRAWVRIKNQAESFAVFVVYRDLGPGRSMAEVQRLKGGPSRGLSQRLDQRFSTPLTFVFRRALLVPSAGQAGPAR
jgi:hypothetical protein